jgi:hypothetical protein
MVHNESGRSHYERLSVWSKPKALLQTIVHSFLSSDGVGIKFAVTS